MDNPARQLGRLLKTRFPRAEVEIQPTRNRTRDWWVDVDLGSRQISIAWRPEVGFGIGLFPELIFDDESGEVTESVDLAFRRVEQLLAAESADAATYPER